MKRLLAAAVTLLAAACAPALKEPPAIGALAKRPASAEKRDTAGLLRDAEAAWARRPDLFAVRNSEALALEAAQDDASGAAPLVAAARAKAWLADKETDPKRRLDAAVSCVHAAQWCAKREPASAACDYWLAIGLGLQAREVAATAEDGVKKMVAALDRASQREPGYEHGGPERVLAIVLVRAPGWPIGPGDPDAALEHAKNALALEGDYPPNVLALAEAQAAKRDRPSARASYARAKSLAEDRGTAGDPDAADWQAQAEQGLAKLR
ncbi:MAG TPA: hypothetical protein VFV19_05160 [Candidatus Polarisedimenticolaceae bacterium]|nr:hypothetical protein [Candidatus Polarisedimenticolaceae bacterium]